MGASGLPSDWALFDVDGNNGQHRDMTRESLDIILKIWQNDGPFEYKGKYWNVSIRNRCTALWSFSCAPTSARIRPSAWPR